MKPYPTIPHLEESSGQYGFGFIKYDGSNLRFEWSRKRGWYKFGTRSRLFDKNDPDFSGAIELFKLLYGSELESVFAKNKLFRSSESVLVYAEYFGAQSFAGKHVVDDPKALVLIDVNIHKKGFLGPNEFVDIFGHVGIAEVVYRGEITEEVIQSVRDSIPEFVESTAAIRTQYPEGVVFKGGEGHHLWMNKVKTKSWLTRLQEVYPSEWKQMI